MNSFFTFYFNPICSSCRPPLSIFPAVVPTGVRISTLGRGELDAGLVGDAHLLAHPFLAETLKLCVPEATLLGNVGMLAVAAKTTAMLTRIVFVGAALLGSRTCTVSAPTRFTVCCCVPGVVACAVSSLAR